jgi:hypothetical protein
MMMLGNFKMAISFAKVLLASEYRRGRNTHCEIQHPPLCTKTVFFVREDS